MFPEFFRINHDPDHAFPNGVPSDLPQNHYATSPVVREVGADFGIAFDDFDRCFFFDEHGTFIRRVLSGSLCKNILEKEPEPP